MYHIHLMETLDRQPTQQQNDTPPDLKRSEMLEQLKHTIPFQIAGVAIEQTSMPPLTASSTGWHTFTGMKIDDSKDSD